MKETKKFNYLSIFMCIYAVFTVAQNLFEMKTLGTPSFAFAGGGIVLSWATFMITDIMTEVFGKDEAIKCYSVAGLLNLAVVIIAQVVIAIPGTYADQNAAFAQIFSNGPRTAASSFIAFWFGNFVNVHIMVKMKEHASNKNSNILFFIRAVVSTIFGQFVDNMLFMTLAFAPIGISLFEMTWMDIFTTALFGTFLETIIESIFVPFITIPISNKLKKQFE